jgi:hypothetical protein
MTGNLLWFLFYVSDNIDAPNWYQSQRLIHFPSRSRITSALSSGPRPIATKIQTVLLNFQFNARGVFFLEA